MLSPKKSNRYLIIILLFAAILYSVISIVNHYCFRTYCYDLGLYSKIMYEYSHLKVFIMSNICPFSENGWAHIPCLGDHFDLYLILFSPLIYIFGSYTLLIIQIIALIFGGLGMYKLISLYTEKQLYPLLATLCFVLFFGVIHAVAFDYHSNVVVTSVLPWFLFCFKKEKYAWSSFLLFFMFIGKENMALFLLFVIIGLAWDYRKNHRALIYLSIYALCCVLYTYLVLSVIMPYLSEGEYSGFYRYARYGNSFWSMCIYLIGHPKETISIFFDHINKIEFYVCLLFFGGLVCLAKPNYLFMLIPLIAQKMLSSETNFWGIEAQYNVEMSVIVITGSFIAISKCKKQNIARLVAVTNCFLLIGTTFYSTYNPHCWKRKENIQIFKSIHYQNNNIPIRYTHHIIKSIPKVASITASTSLFPHLALRENVFLLDAETTNCNT